MIMDKPFIMWAAALIVLLIVEGLTAQLVTIWFAAGALVAMIAAALGAPLWLQFTLFAVVSIVTLVATRPLAKKINHRVKEPLNADRVIGMEGIVVEKIDNIEAKGLVKVDGADWTARSSDGEKIESGAAVIVEKIEGVKVIVRRK